MEPWAYALLEGLDLVSGFNGIGHIPLSWFCIGLFKQRKLSF